jgi:hypothetical protein
MSGKTRILGIVKARSGESDAAADAVAKAAPTGGPVAAPEPVARVVEPRSPMDAVQTARDLEDAAMAYTEVVRALDAITKTTQAGEDSYAGLTLDAMADNLESAWGRWDTAHRRLIGAQRTG